MGSRFTRFEDIGIEGPWRRCLRPVFSGLRQAGEVEVDRCLLIAVVTEVFLAVKELKIRLAALTKPVVQLLSSNAD